MERLPCLVGGSLKQPVVLPVVQEAGLECVGINAYQPWLNKLLSGHTRGQYIPHVLRLVGEVLDALKACGESCRSGSSENLDGTAADEETDAGAQAAPRGAGGETSPRGAGKGREALGLQDDSDDDAFMAERAPKRARRKKWTDDFRTIRIKGMEVTVKSRHKGRGVVVPLENGGLLGILQHLETSTRVEAADAGRVRWAAERHAYAVMFVDREGKHHRAVKQFQAAQTDALGRPLEPGVLDEAARRTLHRARASWNTWDKGDAERYPASQTQNAVAETDVSSTS